MVSREPVLLIVAAEAQELKPLARRIAADEGTDLGLRWSRVGRLAGQPVILAANGAGRTNAASAVRIASERFELRGVLSAGWCGALDPGFRAGQVVVADCVLLLEPHTEFPAGLPRRADGAAAVQGRVLTVDRFVQSPPEKRAYRSTGAVAVEMEAAGAAAEARKRNIAFYCVRVVSDAAEACFRIDYNRARRPDGRFSAARLVAQAGLSPALWRELLELGQASRAAAEALGEFIGSCQFE